MSSAGSVAELLAAVRAGAAAASGRWLRVWGYDDALLAERRHPTAAEVDSAVGDRPTVLHHVTGHVAVVNTAAASALGHELGVGVEAGVLVERHDVLAGVERWPRDETVDGVAAVLQELAVAGFNACCDATHTNDLSALCLLAEAAVRVPQVAVTAMIGAAQLASSQVDTGGQLRALRFGDVVRPDGSVVPAADRSLTDGGWAGEGVRIGHAKVMPPVDDDSALVGQVVAARTFGFPVAIHVMDIDTLEVALDAIEQHPLRCADAAMGHPIAADRIEHCALALPDQLDRIARLGVKVVTQPSFVTRRQAKYVDQLGEVEQQWLWPLASLLERGIDVGFSSDSPTVPPDPTEWIAAATTRDLGPHERITTAQATQLAAQRG